MRTEEILVITHEDLNANGKSKYEFGQSIKFSDVKSEFREAILKSNFVFIETKNHEYLLLKSRYVIKK